MRCPVCGVEHGDCLGSAPPPRHIVGLEWGEEGSGVADNDYIATEKLYTDDGGRVVGASDPRRRTLLAIPGTRIPAARARELGLLGEKAVAGPPEDKTVRPRATKR